MEWWNSRNENGEIQQRLGTQGLGVLLTYCCIISHPPNSDLKQPSSLRPLPASVRQEFRLGMSCGECSAVTRPEPREPEAGAGIISLSCLAVDADSQLGPGWGCPPEQVQMASPRRLGFLTRGAGFQETEPGRNPIAFMTSP